MCINHFVYRSLSAQMPVRKISSISFLILIGFFKIPRDARRNQWLEVSNLKESDITANSVFCFKHFNPEEIQGGEKIKRLKSWAIPKSNSSQKEANSITESPKVKISCAKTRLRLYLDFTEFFTFVRVNAH